MADSSNKTRPMVGTIQRRSTALAKKQQRTDSGDDGQDHLGGDRRIVCGVGDAGEQPVGAFDRQRVLVEPVAETLHQHRQANQDREVSLSGTTPAATWAAEPQPTHHVVDDGRDNRTEDECCEGERQNEPPPRIVENKEPDIEPEPRIGDVEGRRVSPGQVLQHMPAGRTAREQADDEA